MLISRDVFARTELHRETVRYPNTTCAWCGGIRTGADGTSVLYRYRTEHDGGRKGDHPKLFCCKGCHDAYHG